MTVREMSERMDYTEFLEWQVFYANDPWGELRADRRTALLASQFYNAHRNKNSPPAKLNDFMLYEPFKQVETEDEAAARLMNQVRALKARNAGGQTWRH